MSKCKQTGGWDMIGGWRKEEGSKDQRSLFQFFAQRDYFQFPSLAS